MSKSHQGFAIVAQNNSFCLKENASKNFTFNWLKLQKVVTALGNAIPQRKGVFVPVAQSRHSKWAHAELCAVITQTSLFHISSLNTSFSGNASSRLQAELCIRSHKCLVLQWRGGTSPPSQCMRRRYLSLLLSTVMQHSCLCVTTNLGFTTEIAAFQLW